MHGRKSFTSLVTASALLKGTRESARLPLGAPQSFGRRNDSYRRAATVPRARHLGSEPDR